MNNLDITAVTPEKLSSQAATLRAGAEIRKIVSGQLQRICGDEVVAVVAGGAVRDFWAAAMYGLDLQGSGDLDICVIGVDICTHYTHPDELQDAIVGVLRAYGYTVEHENHHWDEEYEESSNILSLVIQMDVNGLEVDFLFYNEEITSPPEMFDTFNCPINKFALSMAMQDEIEVENFGFCPKNPAYSYIGPRNTVRQEARADKAYQRWQAIRAAHIGRAFHPYANIKE